MAVLAGGILPALGGYEVSSARLPPGFFSDEAPSTSSGGGVVLPGSSLEPDGAADAPHIVVYVLNNGAHIDLALPVAQRLSTTAGPFGDTLRKWEVDWRRLFPPRGHGQTYAGNAAGGGAERPLAGWFVVGWGQREFYTTTPEWKDIHLGTAVRAALGAEAVLHVEYLTGSLAPSASARRLVLTEGQYLALARYIAASARMHRGRTMPVPGAGFAESDSFFEAEGTFSVFFTCNTWAAHALRAAGQPAPLWTPLSWFVMLQLSWGQAEK